MSSVRNRRNRQSTDSFEQYVDEYNSNQDQQQLLPPPPNESDNNAVKYIIKKFGWWILVIMFPYIFGPIIALRNAYSRSKRGYLAARYAHNAGYTDYLWTALPSGAVQFVITAVWTISMGKYDLTSFFERGVANAPQQRYNLRRRARDTDSDVWDQDLQNQQFSPNAPLINEEEDDEQDCRSQHLPPPTGLFAPIVRGWRFVKMCVDLFFLGIYTAFGWTFGRYVEEDGALVHTKNARRPQTSRNGSIRSGTVNGEASNRETTEKHSKLPWIIVGIVLIALAFNLYNKYHGSHKNGTHY